MKSPKNIPQSHHSLLKVQGSQQTQQVKIGKHELTQ